MDLTAIFNRLCTDYAEQNPSAGKISELFRKEGENIVNDHIAFRTIDLPEVNIDVLSTPFIKNGYLPAGQYIFKEKHLFARHFEIPGNKNAPRVFISQLILADCSTSIQEFFKEVFKMIRKNRLRDEKLIFTGTLFNPIFYNVYKTLLEESEYAAWFYVFGFRANHFTVSVNSLKKYNNILKVNELLTKNGFILNDSGGVVKGTPSDLLQQSSTMADKVNVEFKEGIFEVPACYYEFAQRYPDSKGELYSGFIAKSADKIFESTNASKKH